MSPLFRGIGQCLKITSVLACRISPQRALFSLLASVLTVLGAQNVFSQDSQAIGPALSREMLENLKQTPSSQVRVHQLSMKQGMVYLAVVPSGYAIVPVVSERLQPIGSFVSPKVGLVPFLVINAGYFDPQNHKTISYVTQNGRVVADPTLNERLSENQNLAPYLPKIFNRSEFRVYTCGAHLDQPDIKPLKTAETNTGKVSLEYDIQPHQAPVKSGCQLTHAIGGGPQLLPTDRSLEEAVADYDKTGKRIRDPFGVATPNARTAIGITESGNVILLMAGQLKNQKGSGFTFEQLRSLLSSLGAKKAMALDGGSSSSIILGAIAPEKTPQTFYGKFSVDGEPVKRPIKSVLMVLPQK